MIRVTSEQWLYWLHLYFWPLLRVLALISTAPILSERYSQAGKTGVGNNDYPCYRAVATGKRYAAFLPPYGWRCNKF